MEKHYQSPNVVLIQHIAKTELGNANNIHIGIQVYEAK